MSAMCAGSSVLVLRPRFGRIAGLVRETVREMRQTTSLAQVAAALGVTRSRVQQLEKPVAD
jgi:DNA-directed RNA polymerase sigma subunit (sigma70/sigma32)